MRVAVIGLGVIGKAQAKMFDAAVTYDPLYDDEYPYEELEGCELTLSWTTRSCAAKRVAEELETV